MRLEPVIELGHNRFARLQLDGGVPMPQQLVTILAHAKLFRGGARLRHGEQALFGAGSSEQQGGSSDGGGLGRADRSVGKRIAIPDNKNIGILKLL